MVTSNHSWLGLLCVGAAAVLLFALADYIRVNSSDGPLPEKSLWALKAEWDVGLGNTVAAFGIALAALGALAAGRVPRASTSTCPAHVCNSACSPGSACLSPGSSPCAAPAPADAATRNAVQQPPYRRQVRRRTYYARIPGYEPSQITPGYVQRLAVLLHVGNGQRASWEVITGQRGEEWWRTLGRDILTERPHTLWYGSSQ